jgi:hypothetical protein
MAAGPPICTGPAIVQYQIAASPNNLRALTKAKSCAAKKVRQRAF